MKKGNEPKTVPYSEKNKFYLDKRKRGPKEGPRVHRQGDMEKFDKGMDRLFGVPKCSCGKEILRGRSTCDECTKS